MRRHPDRQRRRSLRLPDYDYRRAGAYFVTVCSWDRECLFGEVVDGKMRLNDFGRIVQACWHEIPEHFPHADLDEFVVMPNHVHGIVIIGRRVGATHASPLHTSPGPASHSLGSIIGSFKSAATRRINRHRDTPGAPVWQRNYYERIVRNPTERARIRQYIADNPARWSEDEENPINWTEARD